AVLVYPGADLMRMHTGALVKEGFPALFRNPVEPEATGERAERGHRCVIGHEHGLLRRNLDDEQVEHQGKGENRGIEKGGDKEAAAPERRHDAGEPSRHFCWLHYAMRPAQSEPGDCSKRLSRAQGETRCGRCGVLMRARRWCRWEFRVSLQRDAAETIRAMFDLRRRFFKTGGRTEMKAVYWLVCAVFCFAIQVQEARAQETPHHMEGGCGEDRQVGYIPRAVLQRAIPLRNDIGRVNDVVTTKNAEAQAFYNQGVAYLHSYVWIDAARSFNQALRLDPGLAMAHVGLFRVFANLDDLAAAQQELGKAQALESALSARERRRIEVT